MATYSINQDSPFEVPPRIPIRVDDDGYIRITPQEYMALMAWLERLTKHIAGITVDV